MTLAKKSPKTPILADDDESSIGEWYSEHAGLINWTLAIVLIGIMGWRAWTWYTTTQIESANLAYSAAQQDYRTALIETDAEKRTKSLSEAVPKLESVTAEHASQPVSLEAQLAAGNALFYAASGQPKEKAIEGLKKAQQAFEKVISTSRDERTQAAGQLALGNTLENLFFHTEEAPYGVQAGDAYRKVQTLAPGTYLSAEAKLAEARLLQAQRGRQAEARKVYETVAQERKVEIAASADDTTMSLQQGRELSPEQIAEIRTLKNQSYEWVAQQAIDQLEGSAAPAAQK